MYKVCWCGGDGGCTIDEHFSMHVATLIINGMMITVGGDGNTPNRTGDMVETRQQVAALTWKHGGCLERLKTVEMPQNSYILGHLVTMCWSGFVVFDIET